MGRGIVPIFGSTLCCDESAINKLSSTCPIRGQARWERALKGRVADYRHNPLAPRAARRHVCRRTTSLGRGLLLTEHEVLAFVQSSFKSVWMLELLLTLRRNPQRAWRSDELVRELRSSDAIVAEALQSLQALALVNQEDSVRYAPASPTLDAIAAEVASLYARKPMAVIRAISTAPNEKLRIFSDAFRLKDH
jgi:hypothetical protein